MHPPAVLVSLGLELTLLVHFKKGIVQDWLRLLKRGPRVLAISQSKKAVFETLVAIFTWMPALNLRGRDVLSSRHARCNTLASIHSLLVRTPCDRGILGRTALVSLQPEWRTEAGQFRAYSSRQRLGICSSTWRTRKVDRHVCVRWAETEALFETLVTIFGTASTECAMDEKCCLCPLALCCWHQEYPHDLLRNHHIGSPHP